MRTHPAELSLRDGDEVIMVRPYTPRRGDAILCSRYDLGAPEVRAVTVDQAGADGTQDTSAYTGARTVTLELSVFGDADNTAYHYAERLAALTHPGRRPKLRIRRNNPESYGQTWELELRGNPYSLAYGPQAAARLEMQLTFTAPLGYLEGEWQGYESAEKTGGTSNGVTFPLAFPIPLGAVATDVPTLDLTVGGSAPINPLLYIYGPTTSPELRTDDGERFTMTGLDLAVNQFMQIDMATGVTRFNGVADEPSYHLVDWDVSTLWRWLPGRHVVHLLADTGRFAVYWRDRRFTV